MVKKHKKIGYYIHHHGDGHRQRAMAIAACAPDYFTLLGSNLAGKCAGFDYVELDEDSITANHSRQKPYLTATHYTPLGISSIKRRVQKFTSWIAQVEPALIVIDVSVELALLARLCSTPTVYVRLAGHRLDSAHLEAFTSAEALLCPFHRLLEAQDTPAWIVKKSQYFSSLTHSYSKQEQTKRLITVVLGAGGHELTIEQVVEMALQLPQWVISVIGPLDTGSYSQPLPQNLTIYGWVENYKSYIENSNIIIGSIGDGLLANVIAANKPYICLPQRRPFNEQWAKAEILQQLGAATVAQDNSSTNSTSRAINWKQLVEQTLNKGRVMGFLQDNNSAHRAAQFLLNQAHGEL